MCKYACTSMGQKNPPLSWLNLSIKLFGLYPTKSLCAQNDFCWHNRTPLLLPQVSPKSGDLGCACEKTGREDSVALTVCVPHMQ